MADVADDEQPLVLMGDLNMGPDRAGRITGLQAAASEPTFPVDAPQQQIDHVLVRGALRATGAAAVRLPVSDHRALTAELTVGARSA
jgi:endonuclease/exonuclease/phosphatase family metal-dependent hydrolase